MLYVRQFCCLFSLTTKRRGGKGEDNASCLRDIRWQGWTRNPQGRLGGMAQVQSAARGGSAPSQPRKGFRIFRADFPDGLSCGRTPGDHWGLVQEGRLLSLVSWESAAVDTSASLQVLGREGWGLPSLARGGRERGRTVRPASRAGSQSPSCAASPAPASRGRCGCCHCSNSVSRLELMEDEVGV